ncbi:MAG: hypothetical protein JSR82_17875 [Verrucomicrobia bacterium]|nr:hypothetical protein [Verrucomicrobiota bacterium]
MLQPEAEIVVRWDEAGVECLRPGGHREAVRWDDLQGVVLETTDAGPFSADVFWILVGTQGAGCVVPQGATGEAELFDRLQELPGFDHQAVIAAMSCTENQRFLCWKKS